MDTVSTTQGGKVLIREVITSPRDGSKNKYVIWTYINWVFEYCN